MISILLGWSFSLGGSIDGMQIQRVFFRLSAMLDNSLRHPVGLDVNVDAHSPDYRFLDLWWFLPLFDS